MTALFILLTGFTVAVGGYIHGVEHGKNCEFSEKKICAIDTTQSPYVKKPNHTHDFGGKMKKIKKDKKDNDQVR